MPQHIRGGQRTAWLQSVLPFHPGLGESLRWQVPLPTDPLHLLQRLNFKGKRHVLGGRQNMEGEGKLSAIQITMEKIQMAEKFATISRPVLVHTTSVRQSGYR